jgi:hypothetical protein
MRRISARSPPMKLMRSWKNVYIVNAYVPVLVPSPTQLILSHTSYTSRNGSIQKAAFRDIRLAQDAAE